MGMQNEIELANRSDKNFGNSLLLNVSAEQTIYGAVAEAKTLKSKKVNSVSRQRCCESSDQRSPGRPIS